MQYKLVALDLDDTLLLDDQNIEPQAKKKIVALKNNTDVEFILATGRAYKAAQSYAEELALTNPLICHNGAYIKEPAGQMLEHKPVSYDLAQEILVYCAEHALEVCVYLEDELYFRRRNQLTSYYEEITGIEAQVTSYPLVEAIKKPPTKLLILEDDEQRKDYYQQELTSRYQKRLTIMTSKPEFIEISSGQVDKSVALKDFCLKRNIAAEEVVAIGNGYNDLGMIKWAGLGVAVKNAPVSIREAADKVTESNLEGGVAKILQELFLSSAAAN